ncbi:MAG: peptidase M16 [Gammaproteobacteria bacterium]|nr:MAG: peptidase M16 [Gammaproteobacteria bacterium]
MESNKDANHFETFSFIKSTKIDSINIELQEFRHKSTGALHYHLACDNDENVFMVAFRTVPEDSTGVAHILEHTALCGSEKYPLRDPFFLMIRRSLNTFMNAMTSSDWTAYPFASKNRKDFDNLLQVYMDAAFFSNLGELDFMQEGWRYEFSEMENRDSDLVFKGVVYNEMKGAMSSPVSIAWQTINKHVYPNTTYHYNSGGEPTDIPNLSYADLKQFYEEHYHPSNAIFMTYGDITALEHQQRFEELALNRFEKSEKIINVKDQPKFSKPLQVSEEIPVTGNEDKPQFVMAWLLGENTNVFELYRAELISGILLDNSASPLRKFLETTDIGTAPSPLCGLENSHKQMLFLCGLAGVSNDDVNNFEQQVMAVLSDVAENGIEQSKVEAFLHQLEISSREIGGDSEPFGLQLLLSALPAAIHRGDVSSLLNIDTALKRLAEKIKNPEFIKNAVKELFIDNNHKVTLLLKPEESVSENLVREEISKLKEIKEKLSDDDIDTIINKSLQLQKRQNQELDTEILPKVGIEDIGKTSQKKQADTSLLTRNNIKLNKFTTASNGICYNQIIRDIPQLDNDLIKDAAYYSQIVSELGYGDKDYLQTQDYQYSICGGINSLFTFRTVCGKKLKGCYVYSAKSLNRNFKATVELIKEHSEECRFDEYERIKDIVAQLRTKRENSVSGSGHALAMAAASAATGNIASTLNQIGGLPSVKQIIELDRNITENKFSIADFAEELKEQHNRIITLKKELLLISDSQLQEPEKILETVWNNTNSTESVKTEEISDISVPQKQLWLTNSQVNFCARAYSAVDIDHKDAPAFAVLGPFLRNGYLHKAIREQGGAYGGGAGYDPNIAAFRFFSYRDPRGKETLADFSKSIEWLLATDHGYASLEEAILGVIAAIDKPSSPAGECRKEFYSNFFGRDQKSREAYRQSILTVTTDDLKRITTEHLNSNNYGDAVITNKEMAKQFSGETFEEILLS